MRADDLANATRRPGATRPTWTTIHLPKLEITVRQTSAAIPLGKTSTGGMGSKRRSVLPNLVCH